MDSDEAELIIDVCGVEIDEVEAETDEAEVEADEVEVESDEVETDEVEVEPDEVEVQDEGQNRQQLDRPISEYQLIAETAGKILRWKVGVISFYILQLNDFMHINIPEVFTGPYRDLAHFLILETCAKRSEFLKIIRKSYPLDWTPESHRLFLRTSFVAIYKIFYVEHAEHIGFFCVWAFAIELMIYNANNGMGRALIRETIHTVARMFNSREFRSRCWFSQLEIYAAINMRNDTRIEEWNSEREKLRNRAKVGLNLTLKEFKGLVEVEADCQQGPPLDRRISEGDLIAKTSDKVLRWNVGIISLYILTLHVFTRINIPETFSDPHMDLARILILETRACQLEFMDIIRTTFPSNPTLESLRLYLKTSFQIIYRNFYLEQVKHYAFFCVWAFANELMMYPFICSMSRTFIRETVLTVARMFNSREFGSRCSFSQLQRYAELCMRNGTRIEEWNSLRGSLRSGPEDNSDITFKDFMELVG